MPYRTCAIPLPLLAALLSVLSTASAQSPPTLVDAPGNLEGVWRRQLDPDEVGDQQGWAAPDLDDSAWEAQTVPGYFDGPDGHAGYDGSVWYRLRFSLPEAWRGRAAVLALGGVDDYDWTYVNGTLVGAMGEGLAIPSMTPRRYEVPAGLLRPGEANVVAVHVNDLGGPGGLHTGPLTLLPADDMDRRLTVRNETGQPLAERFADPPGECRILKIIHGFPRDPATHEALLENLVLSGFGGIVCNVSFDEYLQSEELWQSFLHGVGLAKQKGMTLWLYDEQGYPSGNAGELVLKDHPEWQARGLLVPSAETEGAPVDLTLPDGAIMSAVACKRTATGITLEGSVDVSAGVQGSHLTWTPPEGEGPWKVMAFIEAPVYEGTHAAMNVYVHRPYVNLLERAATDRFIQLTHEEYARRVPGISEVFQSTFTDEPSLMTTWLSPMPYPALPWSTGLRESFQAAYGYDIVPLLPALVEEAGVEGHRARCNFWEHVANTTARNFFQPIRDWCHANGVPSGGHNLLEEPLTGHVGFYGDFYRCAELFDYPGIDCLTSVPGEVPWYIGKLLGSIAHLHGERKVMSETSDHVQRYRPEGDKRPIVPITPADIRGTCNRLYVAGVNVTTSYYSFAGLTTADLNLLNEYVGRIGTVLTGGTPVTDVALLYPIESVWTHHRPAKSGFTASEEARTVERQWMDAQNRLFTTRRDYEIIPTHAITEGRVEDGKLRTGPLEFRAVVLAGADTLPVDATRRIVELWEAGGVVVFTGALPTNTLEQLDDPAALAELARLFPEPRASGVLTSHSPAGGLAVFLPAGSEPLLASVLAGSLATDLATATPRSPLRYAHQRSEGKEVYFLINDSKEAVEEECTFAASGAAEVWNPLDGTRAPLETRTEGDRSLATVRVDGFSSVFVVFPRAEERRVIAGETLGFRLVTTPLAEVTGQDPAWTAGGGGGSGEIVGEDATIDRAGAGTTAFRATTTLKESKVDSFCFAQTNPPEGALARTLGLRVPIWVPEGQESCGAHVFVIATVADGGQFIADVGAGLAKPGWQELWVWFESFNPTNWKPTEQPTLEPERVTGLAIGWGGYTAGEAGDRIEFALGPVDVATKGEGK